VVDRLPATASWYSFSSPASVFCWRPYFPGINLYSAEIVENNCTREKKGYNYPRQQRKENIRTTYLVTPKAAYQSAILCGQMQD